MTCKNILKELVNARQNLTQTVSSLLLDIARQEEELDRNMASDSPEQKSDFMI